jgi:hypothetical protein
VRQPQLQRSTNVLVLQHASEQLAVQAITPDCHYTIQLLQLLHAELTHC